MQGPSGDKRGGRARRYVKGDFRFRKGYSKGNPRKMVKVWAEKEMRNLVRLAAAGIRCPQAQLLQMHVLVMSFIGTGSVAAPRLKDAALPLVCPPPSCPPPTHTHTHPGRPSRPGRQLAPP